MKTFTAILLSFVFCVGVVFGAQTIIPATAAGVVIYSGGTQPTSTEFTGIDKVQLYPNPSTDFVHVTISLPVQEVVHLQLFNLLGQTVWSTDLGRAQHIETTIPVVQLANGVYLLQLSTGNAIEERKIVVAK